MQPVVVEVERPPREGERDPVERQRHEGRARLAPRRVHHQFVRREAQDGLRLDHLAKLDAQVLQPRRLVSGEPFKVPAVAGDGHQRAAHVGAAGGRERVYCARLEVRVVEEVEVRVLEGRDPVERDEEAQSQILSALDAGFRPETSDEALIACSTLLRADRAKDAIPLLEAITLNRIEPSAKVWAMLGRAHWMTGTPALAISALNESISINPKQSEAYALRGSVRRIIENLEGALSDYKSALQHAPDNHAIRYAEGLTYLQIGLVREAETSIGQAAAELRDQAELQLIHTLLAYVLGDSKSAKRSLRAYQDLVNKKQNPSALYLDYLLKHRNKYAVSNDPVIQYFIGNSDRKKTLYNAGIAISPEKARQQICATAFWMAQWHTQRGETRESRELLNIAIQTGHPDFTEYQLANWLLKTEGSP